MTASKDDTVFTKHGMKIFVIAIILFAAQRVVAFLTLGILAQDIYPLRDVVIFLFGAPPFSFFDILLGLDLETEGLVMLFQPRNWVIIIIQALHFSLNLGLSYFPFFILEKLKKGNRPSVTNDPIS